MSLSIKIPQVFKQEQPEAREESKHKAEHEDPDADRLRNVTLQVSENVSTRLCKYMMNRKAVGLVAVISDI